MTWAQLADCINNMPPKQLEETVFVQQHDDGGCVPGTELKIQDGDKIIFGHSYISVE